MSLFASLDALRARCRDLPQADAAAEAAVRAHDKLLTKPGGSLGRLEELVAWLAAWQGRSLPTLDKVEVLVFAGNHGVAARGVSAYPAAVTAQMVANFDAGGAAVNQLAREAGATLRVRALDLERPTGDFTQGPAMTEPEFLDAVSAGYASVAPGTDLVALGEMGIGNTTSAAAIAAGLLGGDGARWVGHGTGVDDAGLRRKREVVDAALARHSDALGDPLEVARVLGGRELAAIMGAALAARVHRVPVLLDGFVSTAAAAPLALVVGGGLDHTRVAHRSAEAGHRALADALGQSPLLDLGLRLGEASGAALAIPIVRAALACHLGMATFAQAGVQDRG